LGSKRRRLAVQEAKFKRHSDDKVHLCFGSKKLFRSPYDLAANGYARHEEWKAHWEDARCFSSRLYGLCKDKKTLAESLTVSK
jgi:hypothetical protein